jgi:hypothetical protein
MFCILVLIGITQPSGTSIGIWLFPLLSYCNIFDGLVVVALLYQHVDLTQTILGVSAGAATGLAVHLTHHIFEEGKVVTRPAAKNE